MPHDQYLMPPFSDYVEDCRCLDDYMIDQDIFGFCTTSELESSKCHVPQGTLGTMKQSLYNIVFNYMPIHRIILNIMHVG